MRVEKLLSLDDANMEMLMSMRVGIKYIVFESCGRQLVQSC